MTTSNIVSILSNFENTLDITTQKNTFKRLQSHFKANPMTVGEYLQFNSPNVGNVNFISLGCLIDCLDNRNYVQNPTQTPRVLNILAEPPRGLMHSNRLHQPIRIGFYDGNVEGKAEIVGGNHRATAILLGLFLSGHDLDSKAVRDMLVKVEVCEYTDDAILTDNGSRSISVFEKNQIEASIKGIVGLQANIEAFFAEGNKPKVCFELAYTSSILEDLELSDKLKQVNDNKVVTALTLSQTSGFLFTELKSARTFKMPTTVESMTMLVQIIKDCTLDAITQTKAKYSNLAKNPRIITSYLRDGYFKFIKEQAATNKTKAEAIIERKKSELTPDNTVVLTGEQPANSPVTVTKVTVPEIKELKATGQKRSNDKLTSKVKVSLTEV
jgi:hypothetical protein